MQVVLDTQQMSIGVPGVKTAWADTLDRDLLLPESQANEVYSGRLGSLSGTRKYADKGIRPCFPQSNESCLPLFYPHLDDQNVFSCFSSLFLQSKSHEQFKFSDDPFY